MIPTQAWVPAQDGSQSSRNYDGIANAWNRIDHRLAGPGRLVNGGFGRRLSRPALPPGRARSAWQLCRLQPLPNAPGSTKVAWPAVPTILTGSAALRRIIDLCDLDTRFAGLLANASVSHRRLPEMFGALRCVCTIAVKLLRHDLTRPVGSLIRGMGKVGRLWGKYPPCWSAAFFQLRRLITAFSVKALRVLMPDGEGELSQGGYFAS